MSVLNCLDTITISDQVTETLSVVGGSNFPVTETQAPAYQYTNGTSTAGTVAGVNDLHIEFSGVNAVTLAASASVTYTLSAMTDVAGRSIAFARVTKFLLWLVTRTDGDVLTVGNAGTHPWTAINSSGTATITVADALCVVSAQKAGLVVTSGSNDQVKITNTGSHSITFALQIAGCST